MRKRQILILLSVALVSAVLLLSCEGPTGPEGAAGEDGNANVTLYVFGAHDFSADSRAQHTLPDVTETDWEESAWLHNIVNSSGTPFPVPGPGTNDESEYSALTFLNTNAVPSEVQAVFELQIGDGESYSELRVVQIEASTVVQTTSGSGTAKAVIPEHLDTDSYHAVAEYYGLDR